MASRWFIFWMSLFVIYAVKDNGWCLWFLFFAACTNSPDEEMKNKIYQDTKRIVIQSFEHFVGKK